MTAVVLALALAGMGLWLIFMQRPETTVQLYPMAYEDRIRANAASNGLDPALPAAVILAESSYMPEAVSEANAQGLMQLLPSTAEWVAGKFDEVYREGSLFEPDTNIKYGCWYLGYLIRRFNGNLTCAIAAYHAGQGKAREWLAENPTADGTPSLDPQSIEYSENSIDIISFWNKHLPIFLSVDGEYSYYAINTETGEVVSGYEPEYEDTTIAAEDFSIFIDKIISDEIIL